MRPTLRALIVFLAGIPLSLAAVAISPRLWTMWLAYLGASLMLLGVDFVLALPKRRLVVDPQLPEQLFIGESGVAKLELTARWRRAAPLELVAELDDDLEPQPPLRAVIKPPAEAGPGRATVEVALVPRRRGEHGVRAIHMRWTGPLGLLERRSVEVNVGKKVGVVPNLGAVRAIALRMYGDRSFMAGLKVESRRYLGDGTEFELAARVRGWARSSRDRLEVVAARHRKLLCRGVPRRGANHRVVLAVDAGQLMAEPGCGRAQARSRDQRGESCSAGSALRTGDRVGLLGFDERKVSTSGRARRRHAGTFQRLQAMSAEIDYRRVES